ncbi:MAG: CHAT domain-containing protein [Candidatus Protistobacter heckmanni]|nr:CHAT domain-containing protein [Candidatus Protistobacter heckmanni]
MASLWSVDDRATSDLMRSFYGRLPSTNKEEALHRAQLDTLKKYLHPFYWVAFQLTGRAD